MTAARLAVVIGAPVGHSLSPVMHRAAFAATGIDAEYAAVHVEPGQLAAAVNGFRAPRYLGASVTVPHKQAVLGLCDLLAASAERTGAVNCLVIERAGARPQIIGHNTDAAGFVDALTRDLGLDPSGMRAVLLGAGGAARAVHAGLRDAGAARLDVFARTPPAWVAAKPWRADSAEDLAVACSAADLVVDCTSAALHPETEAHLPCAVPLAAMPAHAVVASLVYHREPALLGAARARGLATVDGLGMLVYQGARAFDLWTGVPAPVEAMRRAVRGWLSA